MNSQVKIIHDEIIGKINDSSLQLASSPSIILRINNMLADDSKGIHDVAKLVQGEVALATRVIRIANSPGLCRGQEITSVADAISRIGTSLVKNLALVVSFNDKIRSGNLVHVSILEKISSRSIKSSVYSYMIAKFLVPKLNPEIALISGLVSRIGHLVVLRYMNDTASYRTLREEDTCSLVNEIGGRIGKMLLTNWTFPAACISALYSERHDPLALKTYADVYYWAEKYIDYKEGSDVEHVEMFDIIDNVINEHDSEFDSMLTIIS